VERAKPYDWQQWSWKIGLGRLVGRRGRDVRLWAKKGVVGGVEGHAIIVASWATNIASIADGLGGTAVNNSATDGTETVTGHDSPPQ